jgi:hypothetical protein
VKRRNTQTLSYVLLLAGKTADSRHNGGCFIETDEKIIFLFCYI